MYGYGSFGRFRCGLVALVLGMVSLGVATLVAPAPAVAETRIIGGSSVDATTVPWTVALFQASVADPSLAQFCGGALIDQAWVLTAAHCVFGASPANVDVGWGITNLSAYGGADRRAVASIVIHPEYRTAAKANDVALLRLAEPVPGATTIAINADPSRPVASESLWTYGWGTTSADAPAFPDDLHGVLGAEMEWPAGKCGLYGAASYLPGHMVCAGWYSGGKDSCYGDSGGPLVAYRPEPELVGTVSFGIGCARMEYPGVYARSSTYATWIDATMRGLGPRGVSSWGEGTAGEIGDNAHVDRTFPALVAGAATNWDLLSAGATHSCATRDDATLWCWGSNGDGRLGDATTTSRALPTQVGSDDDWLEIAAGAAHTCGIRSPGTLWCWGSNAAAQLGDGSTTGRTIPVRIGTNSNWVRVAAGAMHTCGVQSDGTLWCWGGNTTGQLGDGTLVARTAPKRVGTGTTWATVATGATRTCATQTDGSLWCWGDNSSGELGDGTVILRRTPRQIGTATNWRAVALDAHHACATRTDGSLWCWGDNWQRQIGDGTNIDRTAPVPVGVGSSWTSVGVGATHTCATRTDGVVACWGTGLVGELGRLTTTTETLPAAVAIGNDWQTVTADGNRTLGLRGTPGGRRVVVSWSPAEAVRIEQIRVYLGLATAGEVQQTSVGVLAYLVGLTGSGTPTPIEPPVAELGAVRVSTWAPADLGALTTVANQFALDDVGAHRFAVQLVGYLLALGGH